MIRFSARTQSYIRICTISSAGDSDGGGAPDDFQSPQISGGNDTASAPYDPPDPAPDISATSSTFGDSNQFPAADDSNQSGNSGDSNPDFQAPETSGDADTANVPYTPPDPPPPPTMSQDSGDDGDRPEAPEHSPEDTSTVDSIGAGQNEETPTPDAE